MIVTTLFNRGPRFEVGEVEVTLMPGLPHLHVVGLPDASIRESGVRIKSAIKHAGLAWPRGQQIVVNLRPSYLRKRSAGIDLAIALGALGAMGQLHADVHARLSEHVVYGELALDGRLFAPGDVSAAIATVGGGRLLTGSLADDRGDVREGRWSELASLKAEIITPRERAYDWSAHWTRPALPDISLAPPAFEALWLAAHLELSVLVAGPQGSGKSTWAQALHALTRAPIKEDVLTRAALFGHEVLDEPWRPLERPHHSTPAVAMIGGGRPLAPGIISRAHGGVLLMDEFLEFNPTVLEALREPVESGVVEVARVGRRERLPARLQLVATTNLCPCGELNPVRRSACRYSLTRCRSVCARLSGPVMDRFDLLVPSHRWLNGGASWRPLKDIVPVLARLNAFVTREGARRIEAPESDVPGLSHRRRLAIRRVARGLADYDGSLRVRYPHLDRAYALVVGPMESLRALFG